MKLYDYYRSSASYRVRIALNLKGLNYEQCPVSLLDNEQCSANYTTLNPQCAGSWFGYGQGACSDSQLPSWNIWKIIILNPLFFQAHVGKKPSAGEISLSIACDIHPLNNLRVLNYLHSEFGVNQNEKNDLVSPLAKPWISNP